ncbi:hypothetical protein ABTZ93_15140 [Streptomyces sp. NPDC097941]|uniref:hypothetical protein n=1 Tax=Streptomyces sp. NPDC097941 TaxID=3155685 RepID=UPI00332D3183
MSTSRIRTRTPGHGSSDPHITKARVDAGYRATAIDHGARLGNHAHPVQRPSGARGFAIIPRRWTIARSIGWLMHRRRLARDYERHSRNNPRTRRAPSPAAPSAPARTQRRAYWKTVRAPPSYDSRRKKTNPRSTSYGRAFQGVNGA